MIVIMVTPVFTLADAFCSSVYLFSPLYFLLCSIPDYSDNEKRENDQNLDKNWKMIMIMM